MLTRILGHCCLFGVAAILKHYVRVHLADQIRVFKELCLNYCHLQGTLPIQREFVGITFDWLLIGLFVKVLP
jgi:hypothetical protein